MSSIVARLVTIGRSKPGAIRVREENFHHSLFRSQEYTSLAATSNKQKTKKMSVTTPKLTAEERATLLEPLLSQGWKLVSDRDAIQKQYMFKNFNEAFGFLTRIALRADKVDHHPEIFNVYNKVELLFTSHDVNGISSRDIDFAKFTDKIFQS